MKYSLFIFLLVAIVFAACQKAGENNTSVTLNDLKGKWRVVATKAGPDSTNPQGQWTAFNYGKQVTVNELYCVHDSRIGQSFISPVNCAYYDAAGSIMGVLTSDCARGIFMRDTVWMQLTAYDLVLNDAATFSWVEAYQHSKRVNWIRQSCSNVQYLPESTTGNTKNGTWVFDEATQMITVDFINSVNSYNGETQSKFKVTKFTGAEVELKMQGSVTIEFRLQKQ